MNLIEVSIKGMRQIAENDSEGDGIDEHWRIVLPEAHGIFANEVFLAQHRHYIDESMKQDIAQLAQTKSTRDVGGLADPTLVLHCLIRGMWLGAADDPQFQALVNSNTKGVIHLVKGVMHTPDHVEWVASSGLLLPLSEGVARQIVAALIERYEQHHFAQRCWAELTRRHPAGNDIKKYAFVLLTESGEFRQQRNEGIQWLRCESERVDPDVGEDAMADCIEELLRRPLHVQIQKIGATRRAIHDRAIDIRRKGRKNEHVSLDVEAEFVNSIADESASVESEELIDKEFLQLLSTNQEKIEGILHRNAKIGKRRFKVLQMLVHEPNLTSIEIAKRLNKSGQTIGLDRDAIKDKWPLIQEAIYS